MRTGRSISTNLTHTQSFQHPSLDSLSSVSNLWIVLTGCCKFMAQIGRVCVDRLSAGLLPRLSKAAICIFQHRRKFISGIFFSHLPLFREHSVFPFLLHSQGRRYGSCGCFLLFMYTRLYILPSKWQFIHHSLLSFPLSSLWTGCYYLLPSLILVPPSPHPHIHAITIALLITSIVRE